MPKRFQIKLSFTSRMLSMPPTPSFSISSPLIFGNPFVCNFQLLFGPNLPFTGLNFVFSSIYRNPKENAYKNRTQQLCMHTLLARQREDLESVGSRSEVYKLSRNQEKQGMPCCAPVSSSRKQLCSIHEDVQHLEVTIWTHRSQRQALLSA